MAFDICLVFVMNQTDMDIQAVFGNDVTISGKEVFFLLDRSCAAVLSRRVRKER